MSSQLAANHWNQQQAEQEERMRMKKLTLDINERQEQEDYQGMRCFISKVQCPTVAQSLCVGFALIVFSARALS